jgi:hypothetical protein
MVKFSYGSEPAGLLKQVGDTIPLFGRDPLLKLEAAGISMKTKINWRNSTSFVFARAARMRRSRKKQTVLSPACLKQISQ